MPAVFLVGYRATGKSATGVLLAERLQVPFVDTDCLVESATGVSIAAYFERAGESGFRDREAEALRRAIRVRGPGGGPVVATGGGIVTRPENVLAMRAAGRVVWLTASAASIRARLAGDPRSKAARPALAGRSALDEVEQLLAVREPLYREAADLTLSTEGVSPEEVAARALEWLAGGPARGGAAPGTAGR